MYPTTYEIYRYSEQGELEQTLFSSYQSKYRDGIKPFPSVADGIRLPAKHTLKAVAGSELYFVVKGEFDEATGKTSDPYVAVYRLKSAR